MNDALGDRMKRYENVTRNYLPRRTYTIIRVDGCHFHTYTKQLDRPFDIKFAHAMTGTLSYLEKIQGCFMGYVQSDEISLILSDFATIETEPWFGGNVQKIASVTAGMASAQFTRIRSEVWGDNRTAYFDARVWTIPDPTEVYNYLVWRQKDAIRNSISMLAQSMFSSKELHGVNTQTMKTMVAEAGRPWEDMPGHFRQGTFVYRISNDLGTFRLEETPPIFTENPNWLLDRIPTYAEPTP